ncbi:hypothetical protein [Bacillus sp. BML-BC060]|uniref:hypothetical protein n=1 Tax=Bacillus sp. BML-BC060 TaxID=2842487 RepID=UPI0021800A2C|nr:hypothetical protein [Bacillus sp. BML-BC060]
MRCIICSKYHSYLKFWFNDVQVCDQTCVEKLKETGIENLIKEKEREIELTEGHIEYIRDGLNDTFFLYEHGGMTKDEWLEEREELLHEIRCLKQENETLKQHKDVRLHYLF